MRKLLRLLTGLGLLLAVVLVATPANAEEYGNEANCAGHTKSYHTNRWDFFSGHHMDVALGICHNGTKIFWGKNPQITFPTRNIITGPLENLDVTSGPTISHKDYCPGLVGPVVCGVTWKYSVHQQIAKVGGQDFDFKVTIYPAFSQICAVGGSCDDRKAW